MAIDSLTFQNPYIQALTYKEAHKKQVNPFYVEPSINTPKRTQLQTESTQQEGLKNKFSNGELSFEEAVQILKEFNNNKNTKNIIEELEKEAYIKSQREQILNSTNGSRELTPSIANSENRNAYSRFNQIYPEGLIA